MCKLALLSIAIRWHDISMNAQSTNSNFFFLFFSLWDICICLLSLQIHTHPWLCGGVYSNQYKINYRRKKILLNRTKKIQFKFIICFCSVRSLPRTGALYSLQIQKKNTKRERMKKNIRRCAMTRIANHFMRYFNPNEYRSSIKKTHSRWTQHEIMSSIKRHQHTYNRWKINCFIVHFSLFLFSSNFSKSHKLLLLWQLTPTNI